MFESNDNGFFIKFSNGYAISVKWNTPYRGGFHSTMNEEGFAVSAEAAVYDPERRFVPLTEYDDVLHRQTPEEIAQLISKYSSL